MQTETKSLLQEKWKPIPVSNPPTSTRLYQIPKKPMVEGKCWHCGEHPISYLIWCDRCGFYVKNQFNKEVYPFE